MKKWFRMISSALLSAVACCLLGIASTRLQANAETTETTVTSADYAQVWINDLGGYTYSGAARDTKTNVPATLKSGCRFGYDCGFENVEVSTTINLVSINTNGHLNFHLRMQGDLPNASYTQRGYQFRWFGSGHYQLLRNGSTVIAKTKTNALTPDTATTYTVVFSTVNQSDGSVKVKAVVNGTTYFEYTDSTSPVLGAGMFAMTSDSIKANISGEGFSDKPINLYDMANPVTNGNFPSTTINADKTVSITSGGVAGGAGWGFQQTDFYSYTFAFTPSLAEGKLRMTFGSYGTLHRDDVMGDNAWSETGYVLQWWGSNGQRHLYRNGTLLEYVWNLPSFVAGQTYAIEYGVTPFGDGSNRVHLKIDGVLYVNYFDRATDGYTPLRFASSSTPGGLFRYAVISGIGAEGVISPVEDKAQYDEKTLLTSDLGTPATHSGATFDRNGGITAMSSGRNAGYNGNFQNTSVKFTGNFTATGSMILQLRAQSTVFDTPWGGSWTNKGYAVYLYANGQTILTKNGVQLCEGWSLSEKKIATNTDHVIEFGTVNVSDSAVRVFAKIDGAHVVNYLDCDNAITGAGWFTIFNNAGFAGSLKPYGVEYPQVTTNLATDEQAVVGTPVTLSYEATGSSDTDEVTYFVDETKSTATATVSGNQLTATGVGEVVVYACVNGIYSNDITLSVKEPSIPQLVGVPSTIVFGTPNVSIDAQLSDSTAITSKTFALEYGTGEAIIDAETGEITPVKAGTIKVYATVNDRETEKATIVILPVVTVVNPTTMIFKGDTPTLQYELSCPLTETVTVVWEMIDGASVAELDANTGVITALAQGDFSVKVTLTAQSFTVESAVLDLQVVVPVLTDLPTAPIIVGGEPCCVNAKLSNDGEIISKTFAVENVSGEATIDAETGAITPVKAGTVKVYATVNGVETERVLLTLIPKVFLHKTGSFAFGGTYDLNEYYSANCALPDEEIAVTFEMVSGSEYATLDVATGVLTVGTTPGIVSLKVYVTGETFQAVSAVTSISVERPIIVVQNSFLGDLFVGQSVTLAPSISQGGVEIVTATIVPVSGADCVTIEGLTITAVKAGTFKYQVVINETLVNDDEGLEIAIEQLSATVIANDEMYIGQVQQAEVMLNTDEYTYQEAVWSVVEGQTVLAVSATGEITALAEGTAIICVSIDQIAEMQFTVTVYGRVVLLGVAQNAQVLIGASAQLSYRVVDQSIGAVQTVEYVVEKGQSCVSIASDGKLTAVAEGDVQLKVVVNGVQSQTLRFSVISNEDVGEDVETSVSVKGCSGTIAGASAFAVTGILACLCIRKKKNED